MYVGPGIVGSLRRSLAETWLAALLDEAISAVGVLRYHHEGPALEASLALERLADEVIVLVLRRYAAAELGLDLGVEAARADTQRDTLAGTGEKLPGVLRDEDPGLAYVFR